VTIAIQLILSGYGTWLSNDLRGSGSVETWKPDLRVLGPVHHGRKPRHLQPTKPELRAFYREAEPLLKYDTLWFRDARERDAIGRAFGDVVGRERHTCWACAVCSNHAHLLIRIHRDDAVAMWDKFANASQAAVLAFRGMTETRPVRSSRPYRTYLETPYDVHREVDYIRNNPVKEGLPEQHWDFVQPYRGNDKRKW
jgi:REP element-mobilizing transposase RayT